MAQKKSRRNDGGSNASRPSPHGWLTGFEKYPVTASYGPLLGPFLKFKGFGAT
jgi:hypothetical protein